MKPLTPRIICGHCGFYGVNLNLRSLYIFYECMRYITYIMLNRRSQRGRVAYEKSSVSGIILFPCQESQGMIRVTLRPTFFDR